MSKNKTLSLEDREAAKELIPSVKQEYEDQRTRVQGLQTEWNKTAAAVERYNTKLSEAETELDRQKEEAGYITQQLEEARSAAGGIGETLERAGKQMDPLLNRIKKLASQVFVFTLITAALRSMRSWMEKTIQTNDEARQSIAQLKGALLTLAQPLVEVIIPAFTVLVNILTRIIVAAAQLVSLLFGKTLKQAKDGAEALYQEANAIESVGEAAKEAAGSLAGFDEINTINTENASSASGGSGASDSIEPDFSWADSMDGISDRLKEIADLVGLIGAGLALWKISEMLPGVLGTIAEKLAGLMLTIGGLLLLWHGLTDAWENGVDWLNLIEMIGGLAAAALGLYILLGPIAAGIALIVGGLALLATGFHDAFENGWNLQNTLLSIAGILAVGLGIALLTGSWIPLLIAGIASVLLALTVATGHGEELLDGVRKVMEGFIDFFTGVFTGDWELAVQGLVKIFEGVDDSITAVLEGVRDAFNGFLDWLDEKTNGRFHEIIEILRETVSGVIDGIEEILDGFTTFLTGVFTGDIETALDGISKMCTGFETAISSIIDGIQNILLSFLDWLDEKTGGKFHDIIETAKGFVTAFSESAKEILNEIMDAIKQVLTGIIQFITGVFTGDWEKAWEGVENIFKGIWNGIVALLEGAVNLIVKGINTLISGLNKLHIDIPDNPFTGAMSLGFNIPSIPEAKIPRLAQGAVIPPNREFMAVLGDQKSGNNLEAPEDLIRKIVREESGGGNAELVQLLQSILAAIKAGQVIMVGETVLGRTTIKAINNVTTAAGKQLLLI